MGRKIAFWVAGANGFSVCSPGSVVYDHYFSTLNQMYAFASEMGWKLKHVG